MRSGETGSAHEVAWVDLSLKQPGDAAALAVHDTRPVGRIEEDLTHAHIGSLEVALEHVKNTLRVGLVRLNSERYPEEGAIYAVTAAKAHVHV